jgi:hypothetical protein
MTKVRIGGLILVSIGAGIVLLIQAFVLTVKAPDAVHDLIGSYYSAQCLVHHCDPYNPDDVLHIFRVEGGEHSLSNPVTRDVITRYLYPPSTFVVMVPLSLLPWSAAHVLWAFLSSCSLIVAAYLIWNLSGQDAPLVAGALIGYLLANSYVVVAISNPSELVIGMCVIGAWCFIRDRFVAIGILCMAVSLAIKPQVPILVWLYFLLAGGAFRRRAVQTLVVTAVAVAPFIVWVWVVAPHWNDELHSNLLYFSVHGGITDPGPSSPTANELVDLQVIISRLYDQPMFYNLASYLVFAPLFLGWLVMSIGKRVSNKKALYALAAIAPLSMLPIYHHFYDTKLLLLTVPAMSLLWSHRGRIAWMALLLTAGAFFITGDISHRFLENLALNLNLVHGELAERCVRALAVLPAPIILLFTGCFYLWVYRRASQSDQKMPLEQ